MSPSPLPVADEPSQGVIETIARETHHPLPIVKRVFEAELARVTVEARITDYVILFAERRTRDALARRGPTLRA